MGTSKNRRKKPSKGKHRLRPDNRIESASGRSLDLLRGLVDRRAELPLGPCFVYPSWQEEGAIVPLVLTRALKDDLYVAAIFLVDLACLGLKDVYASKLFGADVDRLVASYPRPLERCDPALAMKLVATAADYGAANGFEPPPVYAAFRQLFADVDPGSSTVELRTGVGGKPRYFTGPDDDVEAIVARLTEHLGPDGFDVEDLLVPMDED